jgi:4-alpha-glucanotransferase
MPAMKSDLLRRTARLYGVQSAYRDGLKQPRQAPPEAILLALQALDAPVERFDDLDHAYRQRRQERWQRIIEPVTVVWQNQPIRLKVRVPRNLAEASSTFRIVFENGEAIDGELGDDATFTKSTRDVEGTGYITRRLLGAAQLPLGYHRLYLRIGALEVESHLIAAPLHAYTPENSPAKRWGLFCPLYALHSERSWGVGDFSDLDQLVELTAQQGGHAVATLPMLASFLDEPFNASPYAPVSRLFWNELFLDVERIEELQQCDEAKSIMSSSFAGEMQRLAALPLVDHRRLMALKRKVLEALGRALLSQSSERRDRFEGYVADHPVTQDYAAFRAKTERQQKSWLLWPAESRGSALRPEDFDAGAKHYHLYVQWLCDEQTAALRQSTLARGAALYLDFPLGVNRDGYDVWRQRELFALDMSGGAPPDGLFLKGQNWGFPPLHPEAIRQQGYRHYIDCLRHHMRVAGMLRIDHVMGLHRAYWVPQGFQATDGVYVHYRAAEFHAVVNLESHRHRVEIVGENLGTVPAYVDAALRRHKIRGMHVGQFAVNVDPTTALDAVPAQVIAGLNTHDTATFMAFWQAKDIDDRVALGLLDETVAHDEQRYRAAQRAALCAFLRTRGLLDGADSAAAVLEGWLKYLAAEPDEFLQINLEDLWLEPSPQNVPGTWMERPNWQRRAHHSLEELRRMDSLKKFLLSISDIRGRMS